MTLPCAFTLPVPDTNLNWLSLQADILRGHTPPALQHIIDLPDIPTSFVAVTMELSLFAARLNTELQSALAYRAMMARIVFHNELVLRQTQPGKKD